MNLSYDPYVVLRNTKLFTPPSHQSFWKQGFCYRKLHEYAIITSRRPGSKWEPRKQCNPGSAFCDLSVRTVLSSSDESEYESGWEKQYSAAGRQASSRQMSAEQSPSTITSGHLGPVSIQPLCFFLPSSSVVLFLLYRMLFIFSLFLFDTHVHIHSFISLSAPSQAST